jgi:hypothetical protein
LCERFWEIESPWNFFLEECQGYAIYMHAYMHLIDNAYICNLIDDKIMVGSTEYNNRSAIYFRNVQIKLHMDCSGWKSMTSRGLEAGGGESECVGVGWELTLGVFATESTLLRQVLRIAPSTSQSGKQMEGEEGPFARNGKNE